jgi:plasmid stability protein
MQGGPVATLTIKNLPDALYAQLKTRAAAHRRSINSEAILAV